MREVMRRVRKMRRRVMLESDDVAEDGSVDKMMKR